MRTFYCIFLLFTFLTAQDRIAVIAFEAPSYDQGYVFADRLSTELFEGGVYNVLDRNSLRQVLDEQNLQLLGLTQDSLQYIGKMLNVKYLVTGSILKSVSPEGYAITAKMIDIETGELIKVGSYDVWSGTFDDAVRFGTKALAEQLSEKEAPHNYISFIFPYKLVFGILIIVYILNKIPS